MKKRNVLRKVQSVLVGLLLIAGCSETSILVIVDSDMIPNEDFSELSVTAWKNKQIIHLKSFDLSAIDTMPQSVLLLSDSNMADQVTIEVKAKLVTSELLSAVRVSYFVPDERITEHICLWSECQDSTTQECTEGRCGNLLDADSYDADPNDADPDGYGDCNRGTLSGDVIITSMDPDLASVEGYTMISGNVSILETENIYLSQLVCLQEISGSLEIKGNTALENIDGLASLISVNGDVKIKENNLLANIRGFSNLIFLGGKLEIKENPALIDVEGFDNLTSIGGKLSMENNQRITNVDAFSGLTAIHGDLKIGSEKNGGNPALRNLWGFRNLTFLEGNLEIVNNASLPTCEAEDLRDQLLRNGWAGEALIVGNSATCP